MEYKTEQKLMIYLGKNEKIKNVCKNVPLNSDKINNLNRIYSGAAGGKKTKITKSEMSPKSKSKTTSSKKGFGEHSLNFSNSNNSYTYNSETSQLHLPQIIKQYTTQFGYLNKSFGVAESAGRSKKNFFGGAGDSPLFQINNHNRNDTITDREYL
jgi:hypothetical protein